MLTITIINSTVRCYNNTSEITNTEKEKEIEMYQSGYLVLTYYKLKLNYHLNKNLKARLSSFKG